MVAGHRVMAEYIALISALVVINCADWAQTQDLADNGESMGIVETNRILGNSPTRSEVNTYFALAIPVQIGAGLLLGKLAGDRWGKGFLILCIGAELAMVSSNQSLGLRVRF